MFQKLSLLFTTKKTFVQASKLHFSQQLTVFGQQLTVLTTLLFLAIQTLILHTVCLIASHMDYFFIDSSDILFKYFELLDLGSRIQESFPF